MKETPMTIKLTPLELQALDDCLINYMSDAEGLDYANGNPIVSRKAELELDLSTVAKRKFATYIAATLEEMIAPDAGSGWSSPKSRREACTQLASKLDAAVDVANTVEFKISEVDSRPDPICNPRTELVPRKRYLLPDTDEPDANIALIHHGCEEGLFSSSNADGKCKYNYAAEDLAGLVALPEAATGEYLPEPPDQQTVSCNGLSGTRYDQMSIDDGVEMLRAMGAVALLLNDDLKAKNAANEVAEAKLGVHLALKLLPGLEYYRHVFKQHNGKHDFRIADCKGIEALENKIGIPPATVRTWRQRYRHLPEYRAALAANGIPAETKPERIKKCDSCGTRINLPEGEQPDHDEYCPQHSMRRETMEVVRDLAIRGETYKRIACGEGKYAMLPEKSRIQKIQDLALGTTVSDLVELDELSVLLNRIRGQEMDEMLSMVKEYYSHQQERLSIVGIELVIRENSGASATRNKNGNIQSAVTGVNPEQEAPNTEEHNATPEGDRCVAEPVEEVSDATEKSSVALPDVTGISNVTPAPAVTVTAEPENRNATETTDVTLPAIIPVLPAENIDGGEAVAVVKSESDTRHKKETLAEPEDSGILNNAETSKASPAVPAAEQPVSQEYG